MHTVPPLLEEGVTPEEHRRRVVDAIDHALQLRGWNRQRLRELGVFGNGAFAGSSDFTGLVLHRILDAAGITGEEAQNILTLHAGRPPRTVREHLQAYLRSNSTYAALATASGCGTGMLQYILYGQRRKGSTERIPPMFPSLPLWIRLAAVMGMDDHAAREIWFVDVRREFRGKGMPPLAVEVHALLLEYDISPTRWTTAGIPPCLRSLGGMNAVGKFMKELRSGRLFPWELVRKFCEACGADTRRQEVFLQSVVNALMETHLCDVLDIIVRPLCLPFRKKIMSETLRVYRNGEDPLVLLQHYAHRLRVFREWETKGLKFDLFTL